MKIRADLQIHSKYSQAVSNKMTLDEIWFWSQVKGIDLVATGDWTHPLWMREITDKLEETGRGTLMFKKSYRQRPDERLSLSTWSKKRSPEFLLATEISSIYSQNDQLRRVHNLIWTPSLSLAQNIIRELEKRGAKLGSDGRPIVGISSRDLLEIILSVDEKSLLIPAHAWTPWFALWGSKSGFDTIAECFEDLSAYIYAIETGLSSDPLMNWRIPELDIRSIVSFSDAHSGIKTGREATMFDLSELSYDALRAAVMKKSDQNTVLCTYEYYPEEGKYHWDGHRKCSIRQTPHETRERGTICPVCGRGLTVGVEYRLDEVAARDPITPLLKTDEQGVLWKHHPRDAHPPFTHIVPLHEIISEVRGKGINTKTVLGEYFKLIELLGSEFEILSTVSLRDIATAADGALAQAIKNVRSGDVSIDPGYDGVFGTVQVGGTHRSSSEKQIGLF